ncbi:hypothetical protein [Arsukibacterium sp.]|uniref:DUF6999 family protein n=1 Tax=Arsukibacterium sp. TaxID=1977258 RepID=UPI0035676813
MNTSKKSEPSAYLKAIANDNSLPIEQAALDLWQKDLQNPLRWGVRPLLQFIFAILLHIIWFFKRLPLPQFSAHNSLQKLICWFCTHFVSKEANLLILRHYATESNVLNFLAANSPNSEFSPVQLYPKSISEMQQASFVEHDQELFRLFGELGSWHHPAQPLSPENISWQHWQSIDMTEYQLPEKRTQWLDFESAHALFMCLFCLLLTREQYRDAINGFNLDQSIAIRIGDLIGDNSLREMAYNKYPHYLVGPWNLGQRFLMHGFFTEQLYAYLEKRRLTASSQPTTTED